MHYVLAIQITVQKFGNNRLVKYVTLISLITVEVGINVQGYKS